MRTKFILNMIVLLLFTHKLMAYTEACIVGDTGTGKVEQYQVAEAMYKAQCKIIIHTGDVIYERGVKSESDYQWKTKFEDPFLPLINSGADFYMSLGNHDYSAGKSEFLSKIHSLYAKNNSFYKFSGLYYDFKIDNVCFWAVDSNRITDEQVEYLKSSMGLRKDCDWKLAFGHHPMVSSGHHGSAKPRSHMRQKLHPIFKQHIDFYLSGHDHNLADEDLVENSYRQIISGAGAKLRDVKSCKATGCVYAESTLGFVKAYFKKDSVIMDFLDTNLNIRHSFTKPN